MSAAKDPAREKRIRRKPEDARALILDAAEKNMGAHGPAGIRLQDVAKAAGVSHPTILHHFGSREGLVQALNLRTLEDFKAKLLAAMDATATHGQDGVALSFEVYRNGLAQRMVWLMQETAPQPHGPLSVFDSIVEALHALRRSFAQDHEPDMQDTRNIVHLVSIAALGDALAGAKLRQSTPADEIARRAAFEKWFSDLITFFMRSKI